MVTFYLNNYRVYYRQITYFIFFIFSPLFLLQKLQVWPAVFAFYGQKIGTRTGCRFLYIWRLRAIRESPLRDYSSEITLAPWNSTCRGISSQFASVMSWIFLDSFSSRPGLRVMQSSFAPVLQSIFIAFIWKSKK